MKGKACSAQFMKRIEGMVEAHEGKHKDLVKFIAGQTCLKPRQVQQLVKGYQLEQEITQLPAFSVGERIQPTIYIECLGAPDPVALATQAIEEDWTADQTRQEARRLKHVEIHKTIPALPKGQFCLLYADPPWQYGYQLEREITRVSAFSEYSEKPQPGILIQCLSASDPVTLAKETSVNRHFPEDPQPSILYDVCKCSESLHLEPPSLPEGQYRCLVNM